MFIRSVEESDYPSIATIYKQGIDTGLATFEKSVPSWDKWNASHHDFARLLAIQDSKITGWAALAPASGRCAYEGVAELSIYVHELARGKGIGTLLMDRLILESEENNIWTLHSNVFGTNELSIKLHLNCGFRIVGTKERIAQLDGVWHDNVLLERRSNKIGL